MNNRIGVILNTNNVIIAIDDKIHFHLVIKKYLSNKTLCKAAIILNALGFASSPLE